MNKTEISTVANRIINSTMGPEQKRVELNELEKLYPQSLFIKTHICKKCGELDTEIWLKEV